MAEIESAIEKLPLDKLEELAVWLDEYRQTTHASAALFKIYDVEEMQPGSDSSSE